MKPIDISGKYAAIDETTASMEELTDWYNEYSGSTQIKKFSNRAVAERMVSKTKQAMDQFARTASDSTKQQTKKENDDMSKKATKTASKKTTSNGTTSGSLSGMTLHPKTKENPRREGTNGFKSFAIVLKNPGISYNDYIDKGGRNVDARWDEAHGYLELRAGKGVAKAAPAPKAKAAAKKNGKAKAKPAATVETADQAPS
jgi:hypothetical protein